MLFFGSRVLIALTGIMAVPSAPGGSSSGSGPAGGELTP
jgi:hypothetical protein